MTEKTGGPGLPDVGDALRRLEAVFQQTAQAHHAAYASTNGEDSAWAVWYAGYLRGRLAPPLKLEPTPTQLAHSLTMYDVEYRRLRSTAPWPEYYAVRLLSEYGY